MQSCFETFRMTLQEGDINQRKGLRIRERDGNRPEVSLISRVNKERPGCRIHGAHKLRVYNIFQGQFRQFVQSNSFCLKAKILLYQCP